MNVLTMRTAELELLLKEIEVELRERDIEKVAESMADRLKAMSGELAQTYGGK